MPDNGTSTKVLLLLGAGFSRAAGLPIMSEFGQAVWHNDRMRRLSNVVNELNRGRPAALSAPVLFEAGKIFGAFRKFCNNARRIIVTDPANLEEIFSVAESLRESGLSSVPVDDRDISVEELIQQIQLWLWNVYQALPNVFERDTRDEVLGWYLRFATVLRSHLDQLTIVTTNYDILFEYLTTQVRGGMPIRYPWDARKLWVDGERDSYLSRDGQGCLICKVHGSVNYFEGRGPSPNDVPHSLDTKDTWFGVSVEQARAGDQISGSTITTDRDLCPATIALGTIHALQIKYGNPIPAIIPPTYAKLHDRPWLHQTWKATTNAIKHARLLVVIGYSMPPSDGFMRAMIQGALAQRETDALAVFVVDPSDSVLTRYREFFYPLSERNRLFLRRRSFEEWAPDQDKVFKRLLSEAVE